MGAIVFQEMRESRSLAYMAFTEWINPSYLDDNYLFRSDHRHAKRQNGPGHRRIR